VLHPQGLGSEMIDYVVDETGPIYGGYGLSKSTRRARFTATLYHRISKDE